MSIQGLPTALGVTILDFLSAQRVMAVRPPPIKGVSDRHLADFGDQLTDPVAVDLDQTALHVLTVANEALAFRKETGALTPAQGDLRSELERWFWRVRPVTHPPRPMIVPSILSHGDQVSWDVRQERTHWWALSDERFTPYHYATDQPQDVVMALGSHQGYNLVNDKTQFLVIVDYDARQAMNHTLIAALVLLSRSPDQWIDNYLSLSDPATRASQLARILEALEEAERNGQVASGRRKFFEEIAGRVGSLSLPSLLASYDPLFAKLRSGTDLTPRERPNVQWLLDRRRYETVRRMVRQGRVAYFQANLFQPENLHAVVDFLRTRDRRVSTLYVSSAFDIFDQYADRRDCFLKFSKVLGVLPFHGRGRVLWTYLMSNNREVHLEERTFVEGQRGLICADPFDKYAYFEMDVSSAREWLAPYPQAMLEVDRKRQPLSRSELEGRYYYYRLGRIMSERGVWHDGKLWVPPAQRAESDGQGLPSEMGALMYFLSVGDDFRAELMINEALGVYGEEALGPGLWNVQRRLSPKERGRLVRVLAETQTEAGRAFAENRGTFAQWMQAARRALKPGREMSPESATFAEVLAARYAV